MGKSVKNIAKAVLPIAASFIPGVGPIVGPLLGAALNAGGGGGGQQGLLPALGSAAIGIQGQIRSREDQERLENLALPPEQRALRADLATTGQGLVDQVSSSFQNQTFVQEIPISDQVNLANASLREARDTQGNILLDEAARLGIIAADTANQIRAISSRTGQSIEDASLQILGEGGVGDILRGLNDQVPQILEDAQAAIDAIASENPAAAALVQIEDQFDVTPEEASVQALANLRNGLPITAANEALTRGLIGAGPEAGTAAAGTQSEFERLTGRAENISTGGEQGFVAPDFDFASQIQADQQNILDVSQQAIQTRLNSERLVEANDAQSRADEDQAIEDLQDRLGAAGIPNDSGLFVEALGATRERFKRARDQSNAQVRLEAERAATELELQAETTSAANLLRGGETTAANRLRALESQSQLNLQGQTTAGQLGFNAEQLAAQTELTALGLGGQFTGQAAQARQADTAQQIGAGTNVNQLLLNASSQGGQLALSGGAQTLQEAIASGQLSLEMQQQLATLAQINPQLALQAIQVQGGLSSQELQALTSGANLNDIAGARQQSGVQTAGALETQATQQAGQLLLGAADTRSQAETGVLQNLQSEEERQRAIALQNFQNDLAGRKNLQSTIQLGLTGVNTGIAALPDFATGQAAAGKRAGSAISEALPSIVGGIGDLFRTPPIVAPGSVSVPQVQGPLLQPPADFRPGISALPFEQPRNNLDVQLIGT